MQRTQQIGLALVLGLGLLSFPLLRLAWARFALKANAPAATAAGAMDRFRPPAPRNRFGRLIREAQQAHARAWQAVNTERYAVEAWDPAAAGCLNPKLWSQELLAADRCGELRHAWRLAARAAALARTAEERYRAALFLAMLACETGDPQTELQEARVLARLAPRSCVTRLYLRHAARHEGELR